jgi:geranylgeranyl reductase family protein
MDVPLGGEVRDAYDALVIGGGPGGSATAFHLASGGARVLLCEKQRYPRDKVCGDGLTPRAVRALDHMGLRGQYQSWSRSAGLKVHGGGHVIELPWPELEDYPSFGLARPRGDLDQLLARTAAKAGAKLWEATDVVEPLVEGGLVRGAVVRREGEDPVDVRAEVVVAADGASSRFAQSLGLVRDEHRPIGVAIRQYYRSERDTDPWIDSYLELWKGDHLLPGYGWVFPLADGTVNVGCGLLNTSEGFRNTNYRDLLKQWLPTVAAEWGIDPGDPVARPRSAPLPMGASRHPPVHRGVLFVGDAAGLVNPFNGEGIDYAME